MVSSEVQRTLVKSPPELWAELSNPAALARHLGELGEIRITRIEPESTVEWEAEHMTGTVTIKASGWGTRVTLSVCQDLPPEEPDASAEPGEQAQAQPESTPIAAQEPVQAAEPQAQAQPESTPIAAQEPVQAAEPQAPAQPESTPIAAQECVEAAEPQAMHEPEPTDEAEPTHEPTSEREFRRGLLGRLLGWRRRRIRVMPTEPSISYEEAVATPSTETLASGYPPPASELGAQTDAFAAIREALAHAPASLAHVWEAPPGALPVQADAVSPEPASAASTGDGPAAEPPTVGADTSEPSAEGGAQSSAGELSAQLLAAEEAAAEEVRAVLTGVLDRLGAAHHRPFSRA